MAWLFDGVNDYVTLADNAALTLPDGDWTRTILFKLASTTDPGYDPYLIHHRANPSAWFLLALYSPNGTVLDMAYCGLTGDDYIPAAEEANWTPNTNWNHLLVERDGDNFNLYLNGTLIASETYAGQGAINPSGLLYFGRNSGASSGFFAGALAEFAQWNRVLTSGEKAQLWDGSGGVPPNYIPSPVVYVPMYSGDYTEKISGLTVTNNGTTGATHPVVRYPLTMPLLSNSPTLHAPTLSASYTLVAPHLSSSLSLLAPTLAQAAGGQTLEVPLLSVAPSLFSPGFVYAQSIEGPFHSIAPTLFAPTIVNAAALGVPLLNVAPTLHAPTLDPEVILFVPHLASTLSLFAPSLSPNLIPPVLSVAPTLYGPTLFAQYTLELPVINVSPSLYSPVILGPSFPNVQSVTATTTSGVTSHQINMPATVNEGDLLMVLVTNNQGNINSYPSGWTVLFDHPTTPVFLKRAAGTEGGGSITVGTSSSSNMSAQVYRITGWRDSGTLLNDVEIATVVATSATPDPPSLNPTNWGLEDTLWVVYAGWFNSETLSLYPTNYIGGVATGPAGARMGSAYRKLGASSEDPGTFSISNSATWRAHTIAVRPAIAPKFITAPRLELAPNLLPPTLFLDTTQQIVAPLLSLTTTFYPPTLRRIWELVTPNSGTPFSLVAPSSGPDFTLVG